MEPYAEEAINENDCNIEDKLPVEIYCSSDTLVGSNDGPCNGFDCNICMDSVEDPVVTLCGHLYCWPCIYKWLHLQSISSENEDLQMQQQCPVCKAEVSKETLIPIFGGGQITKPSKSKVPNIGIIIPRRPFGLACGFDSPRSSFRSSTPSPRQQIYHGGYLHSPSMLSPSEATINMYNPMIGMFGEMIYGRVFGNSITNIYGHPGSYNIAGSNSPRMRRRILEVDKSLSRICFFLFCCVFLCFLSF
ncbi:E3 ubiquitin-protein ligase RMA1H1 [Manihot esculenta]|uniref:E3 ubiquitin-protein ligase RMA n=1 Tax=Manihot esculenta TaxID=3983 RepID=A0A2C9UUY4_MANES|nr:E3 ubiquitin-protein ligase RMA1H1 [Manihot esculenta]OAY35332.1 hypothetical protein MANES_12G089674v8 [Manihot esculenta]